PPPFLEAARSGDGYYSARYLPGDVPSPDYTVMNWWDQGYWVTQRARRVPVSNPTQERAPNAAGFYAETDPSRAKDILSREVARYVLSDWELPFRMLAAGTIMGRLQNVLEWAGVPHDPYYEILYRREGNGWTPMWIFREAYYQSMAFRLSVLGGRAAEPSNATTVIATAARVDHNGVRFREVLSSETYSTYEE